MDSYIMDFVIKYWKQDPELGLAYQSGERLLLSPLFITVNVCCHSFLLHWAFSCPCLLALFLLFFMSFFLFFFVWQYVLQMETSVARDNDGNPVLPVVHSSFVLEDAVQQFKFFVSDGANLLDAKLVSSLFFVIYFFWFVAFLFIVIFGILVLVVCVERTFDFIFLCEQIMIPRFKDGHYSLYTMNQHRQTLDIHDSRKYTGHPDVTTRWRRTDYHADCTEVVCYFFFVKHQC